MCFGNEAFTNFRNITFFSTSARLCSSIQLLM